jgi:hypothetical protein
MLIHWRKHGYHREKHGTQLETDLEENEEKTIFYVYSPE